MEIRRILVPTDFSHTAEHAVDYAVKLAKRCSAELYVLHSLSLPSYPLPESGYATTDLTRRVLAGAQSALDSLAPRLEEEGVAHRLVVQDGVPHQVIDDFARAHDVSLVVMGTHGRRGFQRVMYGSVTARALRTLSTPTIVVPPGGGRPPHCIVVAYDFSSPAKRAAEVAGAIHAACGGPLHLVHAYVDYSRDDSRLPMGLPTSATEVREQALRVGLNEMLESAASELFENQAGPPQTRLVVGDPVEAVIAVAEEVGADLICAGTTGKGGVARMLLGSVARRLVEKSTLPVLFTHSEE